jgi:hypothetical protein
MNSIPVYFMLMTASHLINDSDEQCHRKDFEIADAWANQAWGILRAVREYNQNGGDLTFEEEERLSSLEGMQDKLVEKLAETKP